MNWHSTFFLCMSCHYSLRNKKTHRFVLSLTPPALSHDFQHGGAKVTANYFAHGYL
jgi:hypothetical protein